MKTISLADHGDFKAKEILIQIMSVPAKDETINYSEMSKRVRVIEALEKAKNSVDLEDADYNYLVEAIKKFPFAFAKPELFKILSQVTVEK